jgi:hypothetical protein
VKTYEIQIRTRFGPPVFVATFQAANIEAAQIVLSHLPIRKLADLLGGEGSPFLEELGTQPESKEGGAT